MMNSYNPWVASTACVLGLVLAANADGPATQKPAPAATKPAAPALPPFAASEDREYAVYAAILAPSKHPFVFGVPKPAKGAGLEQLALTIVTADYRIGTFAPDLITKFGDPPDKLDDDAAQMLGTPSVLHGCPESMDKRFFEANQSPAKIDVNRIKVEGLEIIPIEQKSYAGPQRPDHRDDRHRYPRSHGITQFSRAAFSADGKLAVVSTATQIGQFGSGQIYFLKLDDKGWHIVESRMIWIT